MIFQKIFVLFHLLGKHILKYKQYLDLDLDDTVFKYASPCYVDFEWDEEKIESEIVNETNVDNNN